MNEGFILKVTSFCYSNSINSWPAGPGGTGRERAGAGRSERKKFKLILSVKKEGKNPLLSHPGIVF